MNGKLCKKHKPRKCTLTEDQMQILGEALKKRFFSKKEIEDYVADNFHWKADIYRILDILDARGYKVAEEERKTSYGYKTLYKAFTLSEYDIIEEEHRENAYRRCLEKTS